MPTVHEQLAAEESKLARLIRRKPSGPAAKIAAMTAEVQASAAKVRTLREQARTRPSPGRAAAMRERDRRDAERKAREPARKAFSLARSFAHPELQGVSLRADRLSPEQGKELHDLVSARIEGGLRGRDERRYKRLLATAAGEPKIWDLAEARSAAEEREAAEAERAREAGMPVRVFRGKGGCYLPGFLHSWLHNVEAESFSVVDLAVLATVALGLENGKSPFAKSEFAAGAIVIDSALGFTFLPHLNPGGDIGERRARDSIVYLNANDLLSIDTASDGRTTIALGSRMRKLLEATPDAAA